MRVKIVDREATDRLWGTPSYNTAIVRELEIPDNCPVCGAKRGEPVLNRYCENETFYYVHNWKNTCGHQDNYADLIKQEKNSAD